MGREHEDVVLATGRLENAISFNCIVDWLSPTKVRRTRVLGERGMLVADTLTADLTFYENGSVSSEWADTQARRGVSEGDMTRYALPRREPLLVELETFCDLVAGDLEAAVVTLNEGLDTVVVAEAALTSSQRGITVAVAGAPA
jgi:predicted dehydrogenase